jgi:MFS family permease
VAGSFLARLPTTMVVIALVLSGKRLGSYGLGAALAGLFTLAAGASALWRGRRLDRRELRRGLVGEIVVVAAAWAATAVLVQVRAPLPLVAASITIAGVASSAVLAAYRSFLPDVVGADLVAAAYAIDAVLLEVAFVTGPAVAGGLALLLGPAGVLGTMAGFGVLAAALARSRLPERHPPPAGTAPAPPPWSDPLVVANYLMTFAVGAMVGLIEAGFAPLAVLLGTRDGVGGLFSGAYALGSGIGGLVFATGLASRSSRGRLAVILVAVLGLLVLPVAWTPSVAATVALLVVAGLPFATANASASGHLQSRLPPGRATEGFALATASVLLGVAAGDLVASIVLATDGSPRLLYVLGPVPPLVAVAALAAWSARRTRRAAPAS